MRLTHRHGGAEPYKSMTVAQWAKLRDIRPEPIRVEPQGTRLVSVVAKREGSRLVKPVANVSVESGMSSKLLAVRIREYFRSN